MPEVVDRFTVSKDGRTYTFELKRTFRFHTGAPVTARSFADAFNRVANPKLESPATTYMREIVGATAVIDGNATSIAGVRALSRYRLQIRLTKPVGDFTARLTLPFFCPILPTTPIDPGGIDNPAGSGPYYVAERIVNQRIVMKRNPYYRGDAPGERRPGHLGDRRRSEACTLAVAQDRTDDCGSPGVPPAAYRELGREVRLNRPGGQLFVSPSFATWFFAFNHRRPAFKGPGQSPLKKAINFAIDRPEMARAFFFLAGKRTDQILPPALGRAASIYPARGRRPRHREAGGYAERSSSRTSSCSMRFRFPRRKARPDPRLQPRADRHRRRGEVLQQRIAGREAPEPGRALRHRPQRLYRRLRRRGGVPPCRSLEPRRRHRRQPRGPATSIGESQALGRLTGEARRNAWAALELDLMRNDPPVAPFVHARRPAFVSRSLGCFLDHPVYGFDIAAVCKK